MDIQFGGDVDLSGGARGGARKKMYKKKHCSPKKSDIHGTCLDKNMILKIAKSLNKLVKKNNNLRRINLNQSFENIHGDICLNIQNISKCNSEACWMKIKSLMEQFDINEDQFKTNFKPLMPQSWKQNYNKWLTTTEIEDCLNQHMEADNNFYFYGAVPIDFKKCSVSNLCSFNIKKHLSQGQSKIGIIFNTDPSTKDGEHWISMYIDLGKHNSNHCGIYYFDSYGKKPCKEINELIHKIKKQGLINNRNIIYFYNDISYQKQNTQCGMYAIHFIKKMLEGLSFQKYLQTSLNDNLMLNLRKEYFLRI